jgi:PTH1 family peptidyl-tRNA hydrolase
MGFWLVERFAQELGIDLSRRGFLSAYGRGKIANEEVILAKPLTYMNLSGEAVRRLLHFFKVPPENLVVLHDDLDLPCGKIRIRLRGGHGGHQGVKSIVEALGNDSFVRLKVGIGRPADPRHDPADYVLEPLSGGEKEEFEAAVERALEALEALFREGPQAAMDKYHGN